MSKALPSIDQWLREAKKSEHASKIGMFLTHNGVVRETSRAAARGVAGDTSPVTAMEFSYNEEKVDKAIEETLKMEGIFYVRVWLNEGRLLPGDDIMYILIGGDIRPHVTDALQALVGTIKNNCVEEKEIH